MYGGTKAEMQKLMADAEKLTGKHYTVGDFGDTVEAIHAIQNQLGITGTTAKEAAETLSGSFLSMKASAKDLLGNLAIGGDVKTPLKNLLNTSYTFLVGNLFPMVVNVIKGTGEIIKAGIPMIFPAISSSIPKIIAMAEKVLPQIGGSIGNNLPKILSTAFNGLDKIADVILKYSPKLINAGFKMLNKLADGIIAGLPIVIQKAPVIIGKFADVINKNAPTVMVKGALLIGKLAIGIIKAIPVLIKSIPKIIRAIVKVWMAFNWIKLGTTVVKGTARGLKGLVSKATKPFKKTLSSIKGLANKIVSAVKRPFSTLQNIARRIFNNVKNSILNPIKTAQTKLSSMANKIKSIFRGLKIRIPKPRIPKITVSGGKAPFGIAGKGSVPSFHVHWMAKGGIFDKPTLLGNYGVGEAGAEAVLPLTKLWKQLDNMQNNINQGVRNDVQLMYKELMTMLSSALEGMAFYVDSKELARATAHNMAPELNKIQVRSGRKAGHIYG